MPKYVIVVNDFGIFTFRSEVCAQAFVRDIVNCLVPDISLWRPSWYKVIR